MFKWFLLTQFALVAMASNSFASSSLAPTTVGSVIQCHGTEQLRNFALKVSLRITEEHPELGNISDAMATIHFYSAGKSSVHKVAAHVASTKRYEVFAYSYDHTFTLAANDDKPGSGALQGTLTFNGKHYPIVCP